MNNDKVPAPKPKDPENLQDQFMNLVEIVGILRKKCPWDSRQTNESIAYLSIEEVYEMVEAIKEKDDPEFSKELGDLLLHIILHSIMADERGAFSLLDVIKRISKKLVYRHPHVFGDVNVEDEEEVMQNWENLKIKEGKKSVLQGVPNSLPALLRSERIQFKASKVGFDWEDKKDVWHKVEEEFGEFRQELENGEPDKAFNELGDILFAVVNVARKYDISPEEALQKTNNKFIRRFKYIEEKAKESDKSLNDMSLSEMDAIWNEAKENEGR